MNSTFIKAFKEVIREQVLQNRRIDIEGFGEFRVRHKKQAQKKHNDGKVVMIPPADVIEFESKIKPSDED